jgi:hypothetical protein
MTLKGYGREEYLKVGLPWEKNLFVKHFQSLSVVRKLPKEEWTFSHSTFREFFEAKGKVEAAMIFEPSIYETQMTGCLARFYVGYACMVQNYSLALRTVQFVLPRTLTS